MKTKFLIVGYLMKEVCILVDLVAKQKSYSCHSRSRLKVPSSDNTLKRADSLSIDAVLHRYE